MRQSKLTPDEIAYNEDIQKQIDDLAKKQTQAFEDGDISYASSLEGTINLLAEKRIIK